MSDYSDEDYALYPKTGGGTGFEAAKNICDGRQYRDTNGLVETPYGFVRANSTYCEGSYKVSQLAMIKEKMG